MPTIVHTILSPCENERRVFNEAFTARWAGYRVEILGERTAGTEPQTRLEEGVEIRRLTLPRWARGPLRFLLFNWKVYRALRTRTFEVLHAHDLWVLPGSLAAARKAGRPLVYDAHEFCRDLAVFRKKPLSRLIWRFTERRLLPRTNALITINEFHDRLYRETYRHVPPGIVLYNYPRRREVEDSPLPNSSRREGTVLFQGIFKPARGLPELLRALTKIEDARLWLVGSGEIEENLRRLVREWRLQKRVEFKGMQPWDRVLRLTRQARVGVVLFEPDSTNYRYASPNKFFEYVAAGTPLIASDIPTFRQFLQEFEVGVLVPPHSPEAIARAVSRLLKDRELWQRLHRNCLQARQRWIWEAQEERLLALYRRLTKGSTVKENR